MKKTVSEVRENQVKITDAFWSQMQEKVIDVVIPFQEKVLNDEIPGEESCDREFPDCGRIKSGRVLWNGVSGQ